MFESFGHFLTLLLGLISLLGLFFGYFTRKSLMETQGDLKQDLKEAKDAWETRFARMEKNQDADRTEIQKRIDKADALFGELSKLTGSSFTTPGKPRTPGPDVVASAASALDQDLKLSS